MSDEIMPALTAGEWRRSSVHIPGPLAEAHTFVSLEDDGTLIVGYQTKIGEDVTEGWAVFTGGPTGQRLAALMALANAALPDEDPRKITRGDVASLQRTATALENDDRLHCEEQLTALLAKLRAILPPEGA